MAIGPEDDPGAEDKPEVEQSCGNEGHMVKDGLGNVVCPKELARLEAHKKGKLN